MKVQTPKPSASPDVSRPNERSTQQQPPVLAGRIDDLRPSARLAVAYCLHDDDAFLAASIASFKSAGRVFAFVSKVPWHDEGAEYEPGDWERTARIARDAGAEVIVGEWASESEHRQSSMAWLLENCFTHALIPDGDEIIEPQLLQTLIQIAGVGIQSSVIGHQSKNPEPLITDYSITDHSLVPGIADRVYVHMDTYWKSPEYVIRPRERITPCILIDLRSVTHWKVREFHGGRPLTLSPEHGVLHHLSYCEPVPANAHQPSTLNSQPVFGRIARKLATFTHRDEIIPGWYENVWLAWDDNKLMRNLHPTHPQAYGFAEHIPVPEALSRASHQASVISLPLPITDH